MSDTTAITLYEQIKELAVNLTGEEKAKLIRWLQVQIDLEYVKTLPKHPSYPEGWFERTYGSLAEDPIERAPQPMTDELEERDPIE